MKARLLLFKGGKGVLSMDGDLSLEQVAALREAYDRWLNAEGGLLILNGTARYINMEYTENGGLRIVKERDGHSGSTPDQGTGTPDSTQL